MPLPFRVPRTRWPLSSSWGTGVHFYVGEGCGTYCKEEVVTYYGWTFRGWRALQRCVVQDDESTGHAVLDGICPDASCGPGAHDGHGDDCARF
mmetsp:Transcript_10307/g.26687  ORF Transcript_10307/g.26687 Transcript_10307/m.26687 type:complete len:93 (+) Transcript_10307:410-688(+)